MRKEDFFSTEMNTAFSSEGRIQKEENKLCVNAKGKVISITGRGGSQGCKTSRPTHFLDRWR
jgi:hypothetical protein